MLQHQAPEQADLPHRSLGSQALSMTGASAAPTMTHASNVPANSHPTNGAQEVAIHMIASAARILLMLGTAILIGEVAAGPARKLLEQRGGKPAEATPGKPETP